MIYETKRGIETWRECMSINAESSEMERCGTKSYRRSERYLGLRLSVVRAQPSRRCNTALLSEQAMRAAEGRVFERLACIFSKVSIFSLAAAASVSFSSKFARCSITYRAATRAYRQRERSSGLLTQGFPPIFHVCFQASSVGH